MPVVPPDSARPEQLTVVCGGAAEALDSGTYLARANPRALVEAGGCGRAHEPGVYGHQTPGAPRLGKADGERLPGRRKYILHRHDACQSVADATPAWRKEGLGSP